MKLEIARLRPMPAEESHAVDMRGLALACMSKALEYLDSDPSISPVIGSQLQLAIDKLWASMPSEPRLAELG